MCNHKARTTENDRNFLRTCRIQPFDCATCEGKRKELPKAKLRVEMKGEDKDD